MFSKIKEFFTGSKPVVETTTQEVPLTAADVAIKNIKETTASVDAKVEVAQEPAVKETPWIEKPPAPIAKRAPRPQSAKATPAAKRKKPAPKTK
jgi:hypothetical protein